MAKQDSRLIELQFPLGGLNRQAGFNNQPPYTTPLCANVRPFDVVNLESASMHGMRARGGSRAPLIYYIDPADQEQVDNTVQMLNVATVLSSAGVASNILLCVTNGVLYENSTGVMQSVTSELNSSALQLQGTQVGEKFYIADYRPTSISGIDGTIASGNRLSENGNLTDTILDTIDTDVDMVWISGNIDRESNIYPITGVVHGTPGYLTFDGTMTNQAGGVTWQVGRIPKVYDPNKPTTAITKLMDVLPVPPSYYNVGTVTSAGGGAFTSSGATWSGIHAVDADHPLVLEIPNANGIGNRQYAVSSINTGANTLQLVDTTNDSICSGVSYTLLWESDYYGVPPLNCNLCCTYRGRLVLAGPGPVWYMSRVLNPNDWDYGYDPNDPSRAVAGTSSTTGGISEPILALIPHSDDYLVFGCERSLWLLTSDPAYGGTISAISRDVGVLGPNAWCNMPDGSIVFLSRDGIYHLPAGGQSKPQSISREKLPLELTNLNWVSSTISLCYDVTERGIHISITSSGVSVMYFLDWATQSFWKDTTDTNRGPTAMCRYAASSAEVSVIVIGGTDGYVYEYLRYGLGGTGSWTQGTGTNALGGVLKPEVNPHWTVNALAGSDFWVTIGGTSTRMICYSNTETEAKMTVAGGASEEPIQWMFGEDDTSGVGHYVTYGPFRFGGPGYNGEVLQISADIDPNGGDVWYDIFPGNSAQEALDAASYAYGNSLRGTWYGTFTAGLNRIDYPHAIGGSFVIGIKGALPIAWSVEGIRIEARKRGPIR